MPRPDCNDPNDLLVGNLIIEARKQHPNIPAHVIHDAWLAKKLTVSSKGNIRIFKPFSTGNGNGNGSHRAL